MLTFSIRILLRIVYYTFSLLSESCDAGTTPLPKKKMLYTPSALRYIQYTRSFLKKQLLGSPFFFFFCLCVCVFVPFLSKYGGAEHSTTVQRLIIGSKIYTIPGPEKEDELWANKRLALRHVLS